MKHHDPDLRAWLDACTEVSAIAAFKAPNGQLTPRGCAEVLANYEKRRAAMQSHHDARVEVGLPVGDDPEDTLEKVNDLRNWPEARGIHKVVVRAQETNMSETEEEKIARLMGNKSTRKKTPFDKSREEIKVGDSDEEEIQVRARIKAWDAMSYDEQRIVAMMGNQPPRSRMKPQPAAQVEAQARYALGIK